MLLNLSKKPPVTVPILPIPPEVRILKDEAPIRPQIPTEPKQPSRFWCFFGIHKFEIKTETTWETTDRGKTIAKGPMYILRCPVCGKMKAERLGSGA